MVSRESRHGSDRWLDQRSHANVRPAARAFRVIENRLKAMDAMGIDMQVLSINPFWYRKTATSPPGSCRSTMKSLQLFAHHSRSVLPHSRRYRCNIATSPYKNSRTRSERRASRALLSAQMSTAPTSQIRNFTRSGQRPKSLAPHYLSTRIVWVNLRPDSRAMLACQRHRESARYHYRASTSDLRRHARQIPQAEGAVGSRRR